MTCKPTTSPPTLDADISDWDDVEVFETPLTGALTSNMYAPGNVKIQCVYTSTDIYFLYQIPGKYKFDTADNHLCASVATMFQMGEDATLFNMGGCPLSEAVNCDAVPDGCAPYAVDIGAHWELKTTERGILYGPNEGNGDDPIANKDDEFAVGPWCRVDDNFGTSPGNEWSGAWDFSGNATDGEEGYYIFETSRSLTTPSPETDIQLEAGTEYNFGVAFWDPLETATGWTDAGHVVTGCSKDWIGLRLDDENGNASPVVYDDVSGEEMTQETCSSIEYVTCNAVMSPPTLDADISDWDDVEVFETPLTGALTSSMYAPGNIKIQCVYTSTDIYFLYQIPGKYKFDTADNHLCASVATMFQMGEDATLFNMGGCPLSEAVNCDAVPDGCAPYAVDIGAHWELKTTERGILYGPNEGNGDDPIANKDDEFAVGPWCRVDDNFGTSPGNEWSGAWDFSGNATDGEEGYYIFETSRSLTTPSPETDIQLEAGTEYNFGAAFWDPLETATGWTEVGHVVTGCSKDWIGLRLAVMGYTFDDDDSAEESVEIESAPNGSVSSSILAAFSLIAVAFSYMVAI